MDRRLILLILALVGVIAFFYYLNPVKQQNNPLNITQDQNTVPGVSVDSTVTPTPQEGPFPSPVTLQNGLVIQDLVVGTGAEATAGSTVTVNYLGTLQNGTKFDSSYDRGEPFSTEIGVGSVIEGWDQGIPGMKVGGKRKLTIPSSLGYGSQGAPPSIPPNSTLLFEVELLGVK